MIGNGLTPIDMLGISREEVHTTPDQTKNYLNHIALNASHWLNNNVMLSGNMYHRTSNRKTLNGDLNDDYNPDALVAAGLDAGKCDPADPLTEENCSPGIMNRSRIKQRNMGFNFQSAFNQDIWGKKNQFITGVGYDLALTRLKQTEQLNAVEDDELVLGRTWFDSRRMPINLSNEI